MSIEIADIVISLNGRDEGKRFLVVGSTEEGYLMLADGKSRRIEKPKRKKDKHLEPEGKADDQTASRLSGGEKVTNSEIRRALAKYTAHRDEGGM